MDKILDNFNLPLLQVAIIGSGPSGFYAAEALLSQNEAKVAVDMFDSLPTPFGLVRGGVAPDHQKIKTVIKVYEKTASKPEFRFFGNVEFGKDLSLEDLKKRYDAILFAVGAQSDRRMDIPGEDLAGSYAATEFVGWYNGHPRYRNRSFELSCERVAVIGNGNVAMDVTRVLAIDPELLEPTDITDYALQELKKSKVKEIFLLGRRGPAQAAFTNPEIRELCELKGADLVVDPQEVELDELSQADIQAGHCGPSAKSNVDILMEQSKRTLSGQSKKIYAQFLVSPVEICGKEGKVTAIKVEKNKLYRDADGMLRPKGTGEYRTAPVDLVLRSVGYKGVSLPGLPYDERKGTIPNEKGRVIDPITKQVLLGLYVAGWAKRGPSGVIGTNKPDSIETAKKVLEDFHLPLSQEKEANRRRYGNPMRDREAIFALLKEKRIRFVSFDEWKRIDELEIQNGKAHGKIRKKFTTIDAMLSILESPRNKDVHRLSNHNQI